MRRSLSMAVIVFVLGAAAWGAGRSAAALPAPNYVFIPHILGNHCGDFFDDFNSSATGWFEGRRNGLLAELRDGEYRFSVTQPGLVWLVGAPDCARVNNQVAVTARWASAPGNFYGLLFGEDGRAGRAYLLAINTDARAWLLLRLDGGSLSVVSGPMPDDAIAEGRARNRLAITRDSGRILLAINDQTVGQLPDPDPDAPFIAGLVTASYTDRAPADARFDDFVHRGRAVSRTDDAAPARAGGVWAEPMNVTLP